IASSRRARAARRWINLRKTGAHAGARCGDDHPKRLEQALRVRNGTRLENRYPCKRIGGSNPLPSALHPPASFTPPARGSSLPYHPSVRTEPGALIRKLSGISEESASDALSPGIVKSDGQTRNRPAARSRPV